MRQSGDSTIRVPRAMIFGLIFALVLFTPATGGIGNSALWSLSAPSTRTNLTSWIVQGIRRTNDPELMPVPGITTPKFAGHNETYGKTS